MPTEFSGFDLAGEGVEVSAEIARVLALVGRLQSSLEGSRKAVLALDLAGLGRETCEQMLAMQELGLRNSCLMLPSVRCRINPRVAQTKACLRPRPERQELERAARRVLDAGRLQMALLARAQRKLRVIANMLAGPGRSYGVVPSANGGLLADERGRRI